MCIFVYMNALILSEVTMIKWKSVLEGKTLLNVWIIKSNIVIFSKCSDLEDSANVHIYMHAA